jgi:hypothetical protein
MQRATLIVEVNEAMVVISIRLRSTTRQGNVKVSGDWGPLVDVERVVVHQGYNACDLGNDVKPKQPPS